MKVLVKGRAQKGWSQEFLCTGKGNGGGGCGAKLLVEYGDLYMTYSSCLGESESHVTFRCVSCGVQTDISYSGPDRHSIRGSSR